MNRKRAILALVYIFIVLFAVAVLQFDPSVDVMAKDLHAVSDTSFVHLPLVINSTAAPTPIPTTTTPVPTATTPVPTTTTPVPTPTTPTPTTPTPDPGDAIIIDHNSIALFDQIPSQYLTLARQTRMLFSDRSVGGSINQYLDCLSGATEWYLTRNDCRTDYYEIAGSNWYWRLFTQTDFQNGQVPPRILFDPDPTIYDRSNWTFVYAQGEWEALIDGFVTEIVPNYVSSKDVLSFQFSYLNILDGSNIDDAEDGFFVDHPHYGYYPNRERWDISDLEDLEAQYPNKTFIYWTTSYARGIGSLDGQNFNAQMRQYVIDHGKILFDVADIESHDDFGNLCYDNRDGVQYCNGNTGTCENYPNDGQNIVAICQDYTTETDGGHLGSVSGGGIRIAKAFWVLMARLSGWEP